MKTFVEFRSSKFPPYEGEPETINPGLWGKRLAEFLVQKLAEKGIETEEFGAEDWGYYIPVRNDGSGSLFVAATSMVTTTSSYASHIRRLRL